MKLYEFQAKEVFVRHGLTIPRGSVVENPGEAGKAARTLGPVVLKPQLQVKGRGKVGGILFASSPDEAEAQAEKLFAMTIKGEEVKRVLVEERVEIAEELYLAVTVDYALRRPVAIASRSGGIDIEEVARTDPERILTVPFSIEGEPDAAFLERVVGELGGDTAEVLRTLVKIFQSHDAEMVEINPIVRTTEGKLIAVDAVLNINDDSLFRQEKLHPYMDVVRDLDSIEERARAESWTYIELDGSVGILSSGAGITMAILDLLNREGVKPANFLDTAQMDGEGLYRAFDLLLENRRVQVVLVNIFAGLNRCDDLALGLKRYLEERKPSQPIVVRMIGNREEEGFRILREIGLEPVKGVEEAIARTRMNLEGGP